jgi:hypothetical protein
VNPVGQETGLDDDNRRLLPADQLLQFGAGRLEGREAEFAAGLVMDASDALVFAEVEGENGGALGRGVDRCVHGKLLVGVKVRNRKPENLQITAFPSRLAWILSAARRHQLVGAHLDHIREKLVAMAAED